MAGRSVSPRLENGSRFYLPLVDLLSGVVFVLVIMLMAVAITNRDEFRYSAEAQSAREDLEKIHKEIEALRAHDLTPRLESARQERELIRRLAQRLNENGFSSTTIDDGRTLRMPIGVLVDVGSASGLSVRGMKFVDVIGAWVREILPCIAPASKEAPSTCEKLATGRLQRISFVVTKQLGAHAEQVRSESILTALTVVRAIGRIVPNFVDMRAADNTVVVDYTGIAGVDKTSEDTTLDLAVRLAVPPEDPGRTISPSALR